MDLTTLTQPPWLYVLIGAAVLIVGLVVWAVVSRSRTRREHERLQQRYGSEYERTVAMHRSKKAAAADLHERERLHEDLQLRDLNDHDLDLVRRHMAAAQFRFVEDPADAVLQAQRVMTEVLRAKGYPVAEDRDRALRLFSVDHPEHAGAVRTLMDARHDGDVDRMRSTFVDARHALAEVTGASYVVGDAVTSGNGHDDRSDDLRVEHDTTPAHSTTADSTPAS
ncbi:MAG TPA: hypothetical protein VM307_00185 [Egibacteraceae bacterium]|nr:hypothetical protein [Egibacteraceae bacterium]